MSSSAKISQRLVVPWPSLSTKERRSQKGPEGACSFGHWSSAHSLGVGGGVGRGTLCQNPIPSPHPQRTDPCEHRPKGPLSCSVGSGCTGSSPQALSPSPHPHPTLPSLSPSWLVGRTWAPCHPGSSLLFLIKCNDHDEVLARSPGMLQCWGGGILWGSGKPWEPRDRL